MEDGKFPLMADLHQELIATYKLVPVVICHMNILSIFRRGTMVHIHLTAQFLRGGQYCTPKMRGTLGHVGPQAHIYPPRGNLLIWLSKAIKSKRVVLVMMN